MFVADRAPVLESRFFLELVIGSGGSCEVYRGTDLHEMQTVAIKLLRPPEHPERLERFFREAALLAELTHPAIVRYVAHGVAPAGNPYLVMEWLEGETLEQRLRRGPMSPRETWRLARRLAEGLGLAHARGIAHRDLKPSNVFLVQGQVDDAKILDFGIAKRLFNGDHLTRTGGQVGTPAYMSPEQIRGGGELDLRTDIFSLGVTLYECLTGKSAFRADNLLAIAAEVCLSDPAWPRTLRADIPPALEELVMRMLEKDRARRPVDAAELARTLLNLGEPSGGESSPVAQAALASSEQRVVAVTVIAGVDLSEHTLDDAHGTLVDAPDTERLATLAHAFGGRLERMPDGLLVACFSAGGATDQVARAARLAVQLAEMLPQARIAVSHGRALLHGRVPLGDVVERGATLVEDAEPGVRLDAPSAELLAGQFLVDTQPWGATLLGELDQQDVAYGRASPFVGRRIELNSLVGAFRECSEEPSARGVLVTAPPGMGKSRLQREFTNALRAQGVRFLQLVAQGDPIRSNAPFGMVSSLVRRKAQITGSDAASTRREKLLAMVAESVGKNAQITAEFLGELTGLHFPDAASSALRAARNDPRLMADQIRAAWLTWLRSLVEREPVLVVLEDLHWADLASVQLIDASLHQLTHMPLFVLALARPEINERFPKLWVDRNMELIRLLPLTPKTAERLILEVLGKHADPALVTRLVQQAEGNAFFLEELLRAVAMGRADALPDTIMAMLQLRLDALGSEAARVLRAASIFGEDFSRESVGALTGQGGQHLADYWNLFETRELISKTDSERYTFRHALVRETCYAALTPEDRVLGHRLAGEWLERSADAAPSVLAEHFARGEQRERAAYWYARAASSALDGDDLQAVLEFAKLGLSFDTAAKVRTELKLAQLQVYTQTQRFSEAWDAGQEALAHCDDGSALWYHVVRELMIPCTAMLLPNLQEFAGRVQAAPTHPGAEGARTATLSWMAGAVSSQGELELAERLLHSCESELATDEAWVRYQVEMARGTYFFYAGKFPESLAALEETCPLAEQLGNARATCLSLLQLGGIQIELGLLERGCASARSGVELAQRNALTYCVVIGRTLLAQGCWLLGELEEAREHALAVTSVQDDNPRTLSMAELYLSRIELDARHAEAAERHALRAMDHAGEQPMLRTPAQAVLASVLLALGRPQEALTHATAALNALETLPAVNDFEALIPLTLAEATWANQRTEDARRTIAAARDRLLARADRISEPTMRAHFLALPDHARTLRRAREWLT